MRYVLASLTLASAALAAGAIPIAALAQPSGSECFLSREWSGWKATPDSKAIYIRVGGNGVYRLDLASECPALQQFDVHLVTKLTGPWICDPLDLDLHVPDGHGFSTPCVVSKIVRLTPEQARAVPLDERP